MITKSLHLTINFVYFSSFVADKIGAADQNVVDQVKKYFFLRYTYEEICVMLKTQHDINMSTRKLRRLLKAEHLKRKNLIESEMEIIVAAIITEVNDSGMNLGYRSMWQRMRQKYELSVKQSTVLQVLRLVDPAGVERRSRYRLKRRIYKVPGPNYLWHIDGHDKLKRFGFAIHGCADGFSRKVLWLTVSTTNNKPQVIAHYYLQCLKEFDLIPTIVRSDKGTENKIVELLQMALRYDHEDDNAGENSFFKGKSTANERIEKYWKHLKDHTEDFYINLFKIMEENRIIDTTDVVHIECLRFCFGPVIQHDLEVAKKEWNEHRVRKQGAIDSPSGIPNIMFYWPEKYGKRDCQQEVDQRNVESLLAEYGQVPLLYNPNTKLLIDMLVPGAAVPCTAEEAYELFVHIIELINSEIRISL